MYLLYVTKIYILTLLKISYEIGIVLAALIVVMILTRLITKDKAIFTKKYKKFKSYMM